MVSPARPPGLSERPLRHRNFRRPKGVVGPGAVMPAWAGATSHPPDDAAKTTANVMMVAASAVRILRRNMMVLRSIRVCRVRGTARLFSRPALNTVGSPLWMQTAWIRDSRNEWTPATSGRNKGPFYLARGFRIVASGNSLAAATLDHALPAAR